MNSANDTVTVRRVAIDAERRGESLDAHCDSSAAEICFDAFLGRGPLENVAPVLRPLAAAPCRRDHVVQMTGDANEPDFGGY
jgi:hypothetical protein